MEKADLTTHCIEKLLGKNALPSTSASHPVTLSFVLYPHEF